MKKLSLLAVPIVALAALIAFGNHKTLAAPGAKAKSEVAVSIDNFSFSPASVTVPAGTAIRWRNGDDIPHTVVSDSNQFKSSALDTGEEFTFTFTQSGTYTYFCSLHPRMTAKVIVQ